MKTRVSLLMVLVLLAALLATSIIRADGPVTGGVMGAGRRRPARSDAVGRHAHDHAACQRRSGQRDHDGGGPSATAAAREILHVSAAGAAVAPRINYVRWLAVQHLGWRDRDSQERSFAAR